VPKIIKIGQCFTELCKKIKVAWFFGTRCGSAFRKMNDFAMIEALKYSKKKQKKIFQNNKKNIYGN